MNKICLFAACIAVTGCMGNTDATEPPASVVVFENTFGTGYCTEDMEECWLGPPQSATLTDETP